MTAKTFCIFILFNIQNLVVLSHTERALVGGPKIFGTLAGPWNRGMDNPRNTLLHCVCYRSNFRFRRFRSNRMDLVVVSQKFEGCWNPPLGTEGVVDPQKHAPHHCPYYRAKVSHFRSNVTSMIMEITLKILIHRVPPFKVIQGHWNRHGSIRSIGYL